MYLCKMSKKISLMAGFLIAGLFFSVSVFSYPVGDFINTQDIYMNRPFQDEYCFDFAKVLSLDTVSQINDEGASLRKSFDIDFVVVVIPSLADKDIVQYAADLFSAWRIGKSTQGKKGILILIAKKEQKVKIEIGYDLEHIYTDLYVAQVEREILKEFLEMADWEKGFLATIESFVFRIFNKDLGSEIKEISAPDKDSGYYSGGAGAVNVFDFGSALKKPLPENYAEIKEYFSAQPSPELVFQRYMELCARMVKHNNDLTLFTDMSNEFWKGWRHTSGQMRAEAEDISGVPYIIGKTENHAVVFFPNDDPEKLKKNPMYFLSKSDIGWQVDINTMAKTMRCVGPGWWVLTDLYHPYTRIIMDKYNLVGGFLIPWDDPGGYLPFHYYSGDDPIKTKNGLGYKIRVNYNCEKTSNLRTGDLILSINGTKVRDWKHFRSFFKDALAGDIFTITLLREGKKMTITEKLNSNPDGFAEFRGYLEVPRVWMGVYMIQALDKEWRDTKRFRNQGKCRYTSICSILAVCPGSPADKAGLKPNDLVVDYGVDDQNGEIMPYDVIRYLYTLKEGDSIELTVVRDLKDVVKIDITLEETLQKDYF